MLVLSRKKNQTFQFPNLGISIEILRVKGNTVQVGVDAPKNIRVLRGELIDNDLSPKTPQQDSQKNDLSDTAREEKHELRNHLNTANLALHMMQKQLEAGHCAEAEKLLTTAVNAFAELDSLVVKPIAIEPTAQPTQSRRALVVEDNANERQLLAGFLELNGYQVETVEDGQAAIDFLASHNAIHALPDLVLLDMNMPRMDGPSTVAAIRSNPDYQDVKLFVVSGADQTEMAIPTGNRGIDHWFSKPLMPAKFVQDLTAEMTRSCSLN